MELLSLHVVFQKLIKKSRYHEMTLWKLCHNKVNNKYKRRIICDVN